MFMIPQNRYKEQIKWEQIKCASLTILTWIDLLLSWQMRSSNILTTA